MSKKLALRSFVKSLWKVQSKELFRFSQVRYIRHQSVHEGSIITSDDEENEIEQERESLDDILEEEDEFDEIRYKTYCLAKQWESENNINRNYDYQVPSNNSILFNVYPKPYDYGPDYTQSFPINEIIEYLQKLGAKQSFVYDVHKCGKEGEDGYDVGYGVIEDKDWFIISVVASYQDLGNIVKRLTRRGHDKKVHRDSYYREVYSSYFSSEGEGEWCLVDLADVLGLSFLLCTMHLSESKRVLVLVCHQNLVTQDPLSMVNQMKDKYWRFLYGTYQGFIRR